MSKKTENKACVSLIDKLTPTEFLMCFALFLGERWFTDQDLYRFLSGLSDRFPLRFGIHSKGKYMYCSTFDRVFTYLKMGFTLEESLEPGPAKYRLNSWSNPGENIQKELEALKILPQHRKTLNELIQKFKALKENAPK